MDIMSMVTKQGHTFPPLVKIHQNYRLCLFAEINRYELYFSFFSKPHWGDRFNVVQNLSFRTCVALDSLYLLNEMAVSNNGHSF
jgi:hypothetical protein